VEMRWEEITQVVDIDLSVTGPARVLLIVQGRIGTITEKWYIYKRCLKGLYV
jgi:hypothetical protein